MFYWWIKTITFRVILLIPALASLIQFKKLDKASKYIAALISLNFIVETSAAWGAFVYHQNNIIYNIHGPIDLLIICLYFNTVIESFNKNNTGIIIGVFGAVVAILNVLFIQDIFVLNTNFLALQSVLVVAMCLYYYYDFLLNDTFQKKLPIHFWFTSLLLIFWSFTLFHWLVGLNIANNGEIVSWPYTVIMIVISIIYLSFGLLFLNYKKLNADE